MNAFSSHTLLGERIVRKLLLSPRQQVPVKTIMMTKTFRRTSFLVRRIVQLNLTQCFVWLSDMPELNEQTRLKIESKSDMIRVRDLATINSDFDVEYLEGGCIYFPQYPKAWNRQAFNSTIGRSSSLLFGRH